MAVFQYTSIENGIKSRNMLFAPDEEQALIELRRRRIAILELEEVGTRNPQAKPRNILEVKLTGLLTTRIKQEQMMRQMAAMLRAGVPLPQALEVASAVAPNLQGRALWEACEMVKAGKSFSHAFNESLSFLPSSVKGLIEIGERGGQLVPSFENAILIISRARKLRIQVLQNLLYPFIIILLLLGVSYYTCMYALPKIMGSIQGLSSAGLNERLPWTFKFIQKIYTYITQHGVDLAIIAGAIAMLALYLYHSAWTRKYFDWLILNAPYFGKITREYFNSLWCRTLGTLLKNGMEITKALRLTTDSVGNQFYRNNLAQLLNLIEQGQNFADSLRVTALAGLCPMSVAMGRVGQMTDSLAENLLTTADYSEEELLARMAIGLELLQPVLIIILSVLIFLVLYSVYGAIWAIYNSYLPG